jgi:hypothetical protein
VTVTGYAPDNLTPARLPWCWPALVTLAFGFYQVGRPELWRDELASWSFASRPGRRTPEATVTE